MMRALYTAATGMIAQQTNLDTISNNLSNVNTTGYKTERTEFKSLLYQTLQTKTTTANGANKPVGAQVGLGTRVAATMSNYTQGAREETEIPTDFALEGKGFFAVRGVDGQTYYTRNGNFSFRRVRNVQCSEINKFLSGFHCEIFHNRVSTNGRNRHHKITCSRHFLLKLTFHVRNQHFQSIRRSFFFYGGSAQDCRVSRAGAERAAGFLSFPRRCPSPAW